MDVDVLSPRVNTMGLSFAQHESLDFFKCAEALNEARNNMAAVPLTPKPDITPVLSPMSTPRSSPGSSSCFRTPVTSPRARPLPPSSPHLLRSPLSLVAAVKTTSEMTYQGATPQRLVGPSRVSSGRVTPLGDGPGGHSSSHTSPSNGATAHLVRCSLPFAKASGSMSISSPYKSPLARSQAFPWNGGIREPSFSDFLKDGGCDLEALECHANNDFLEKVGLVSVADTPRKRARKGAPHRAPTGDHDILNKENPLSEGSDAGSAMDL